MMRRSTWRAMAACLLILTVLPLTGCMGKQVRQETLMPAIRLAWEGVRSDAEIGGADALELAAMQRAITEEQAVDMRLAWPPVKVAATSGIEQMLAEQRIGPITAELKSERVQNMDEAIERLTRRWFR